MHCRIVPCLVTFIDCRVDASSAVVELLGVLITRSREAREGDALVAFYLEVRPLNGEVCINVPLCTLVEALRYHMRTRSFRQDTLPVAQPKSAELRQPRTTPTSSSDHRFHGITKTNAPRTKWRGHILVMFGLRSTHLLTRPFESSHSAFT